MRLIWADIFHITFDASKHQRLRNCVIPSENEKKYEIKKKKYGTIAATFKAWDDEYCASDCVCAYSLKLNAQEMSQAEM